MSHEQRPHVQLSFTGPSSGPGSVRSRGGTLVLRLQGRPRSHLRAPTTPTASRPPTTSPLSAHPSPRYGLGVPEESTSSEGRTRTQGGRVRSRVLQDSGGSHTESRYDETLRSLLGCVRVGNFPRGRRVRRLHQYYCHLPQGDEPQSLR